MKSILPMFKTKILISQSKANLEEIILFGEITHYFDLEIRKMLVSGIFGNEDSKFHSGPWFTCY